jgi:hypothetical protein
MKSCWIFGIALAGGLHAHAGECSVIVYAKVGRALPAGLLVPAELRSAAMFREIGVDVTWRTGAVPANTADNACGPPIVARFEDAANARVPVSPTALAYATPFAQSGTCIHVFLDRLAAYRNESLEMAVLAHVLAHEITRPLAPEDVEAIHRDIAQRMLIAAPDQSFQRVSTSKASSKLPGIPPSEP